MLPNHHIFQWFIPSPTFHLAPIPASLRYQWAAAILACMSLILAAVLIAKLPLVVRTYDSVGLSARAIERAQESAGITLAAIGIQPIWRPCHAAVCITRPKPHEVEVRLVHSTPLSERGSLGFAAVDVVQHAGVLATIYVDRVEALAAQAGVDESALLGRAVAHEIGHLILGSTDHARSGLMRATWKSDEVRRDMPLDWIFSERQGAEIRLRLAETVSPPVLESIAASDRRPAQ